MKEYRLYDDTDNNLICVANNLNTVTAEARKYDRLCDGDWIPALYVSVNRGVFNYMPEWSNNKRFLWVYP